MEIVLEILPPIVKKCITQIPTFAWTKFDQKNKKGLILLIGGEI